MAPDSHQTDDLLIPIDVQINPAEVGLDLEKPDFFPSPLETTEDGLVCVGGRLDPDWLLDAYRHGIFPWPVWDDEPMAWWCPNPRAILELDGMHISRRLRRTIRSGKFRITYDEDFSGVLRGCATAPGRRGGTWLTPAMIAAYEEMHHRGYAHSVEVWLDDKLAGGIYGIATGGLFAAESKFYYERDASKVALAHLVAHLKECGYQVLDVQQWTPHTARLGVGEISRREYLIRLTDVVDLPIAFGIAQK